MQGNQCAQRDVFKSMHQCEAANNNEAEEEIQSKPFQGGKES